MPTGRRRRTNAPGPLRRRWSTRPRCRTGAHVLADRRTQAGRGGAVAVVGPAGPAKPLCSRPRARRRDVRVLRTFGVERVAAPAPGRAGAVRRLDLLPEASRGSASTLATALGEVGNDRRPTTASLSTPRPSLCSPPRLAHSRCSSSRTTHTSSNKSSREAMKFIASRVADSSLAVVDRDRGRTPART